MQQRARVPRFATPGGPMRERHERRGERAIQAGSVSGVVEEDGVEKRR